MTKPVVYWWVSAEKLEEPSKFLSLKEQRVLAEKRFPKRRAEWLNGRWGAKNLLRISHPQLTAVPCQQIEIENTPEGVPYSIVNGKITQGSLSISHRDQAVFCAVTYQPNVNLGADIERVEPRSTAFITDYFTASEIAFICSHPSERYFLATLLWSAKEAALKALGKGLRLDTRLVEIQVEFGEKEGWSILKIDCPSMSNKPWLAYWQCWGEYVLTLAVCTVGVQSAGDGVVIIQCS